MKMTYYLKKGGAVLLPLVVGIGLGAWLFSTERSFVVPFSEEKSSQKMVWACPMHPQIQKDMPGVCDICGMALAPLQGVPSLAQEQVQLSTEALALAEISTTEIKRAPLEAQLRLQGRIALHEGQRQQLSTHYTGRIEKLYVLAEGTWVRKGQPIALLYAPALHSAQAEMLQAAAAGPPQAAWLRAAQQKLQDWGLSQQQISSLQAHKKASPYVEVLATHTGTLLHKFVQVGEYVHAKKPLFEVADLSQLWVYLEAEEEHVHGLRPGLSFSFEVQGAPSAQRYQAHIEQISPSVQDEKRIIEVQALVQNPDKVLRPGMYVHAELPLLAEEKGLLLPRSAVLWTGKRSVVYVMEHQGPEGAVFTFKEVALGPRFGNHYLLKAGLTEGDKVATAGTLAIDATMQLHGKVNMMQRPAQKRPLGMQHGHLSSERLSEPQKISQDTLLQAQLKAYFMLTEALIASDEAAAQAAAQNFYAQLQKSASDTTYTELHTTLFPLLKKMKSAPLDEIRRLYAQVSEAWSLALQDWGSPAGTLYEVYCPMALDYEGARWLWHKKEVLNPYFGSTMLKCGRVTQEIKKR